MNRRMVCELNLMENPGMDEVMRRNVVSIAILKKKVAISMSKETTRIVFVI